MAGVDKKPCYLGDTQLDLIATSQIIVLRGEDAVNPIPAGVLKNQDTLGGGQFDPPPLNPMFYVQI